MNTENKEEKYPSWMKNKGMKFKWEQNDHENCKN